MTLQDKLYQADDLIYEKRYAEARQLLKSIDHPIARRWLVKLDERELKNPAPPKSTAKRFAGRTMVIICAATVAFLAYGVLYSVGVSSKASAVLALIPTILVLLTGNIFLWRV